MWIDITVFIGVFVEKHRYRALVEKQIFFSLNNHKPYTAANWKKWVITGDQWNFDLKQQLKKWLTAKVHLVKVHVVLHNLHKITKLYVSPNGF